MLDYGQLVKFLMAGGTLVLRANSTEDRPFSMGYSDGNSAGHMTFETALEMAKNINLITSSVIQEALDNIEEARSKIADLKSDIKRAQGSAFGPINWKDRTEESNSGAGK